MKGVIAFCVLKIIFYRYSALRRMIGMRIQRFQDFVVMPETSCKVKIPLVMKNSLSQGLAIPFHSNPSLT